jgi:Domain of unknown function (DUF4388)
MAERRKEQKGVTATMATKGKAERLDDVLESARVRRQSGMLTIERAQGGRVELGELYLQAGHPVYARVGQLTGQDALNWLLKWHNISFSFAAEGTSKPAGTLAAGDDASAVHVSSPLPQFSSLNGKSPMERVSERGTSNSHNSSSMNTPGVEWLVPQKRGVERDVLSLPLTRRQRFIYLLVDGRRTIADLSRCTGKNIQEVQLILGELQEQGLVAV